MIYAVVENKLIHGGVKYPGATIIIKNFSELWDGIIVKEISKLTRVTDYEWKSGRIILETPHEAYTDMIVIYPFSGGGHGYTILTELLMYNEGVLSKNYKTDIFIDHWANGDHVKRIVLNFLKRLGVVINRNNHHHYKELFLLYMEAKSHPIRITLKRKGNNDERS